MSEGMGNLRLKQLLAVISIFIVILVLFIPVGLVYILIIHFTGQYYASITTLILFLLLFGLIDIAAGTLVDSILQAAKDQYDGLIIPTYIGSLIEFCLTFTVLSVLDYFMDGIELSILIQAVVAIIHQMAGLFLERVGTEDEDDGENLAPKIMNDIHYYLQQKNWTDCVAIIHEKYPQIPKSEVIRAVRKVHNKEKKGSSLS